MGDQQAAEHGRGGMCGGARGARWAAVALGLLAALAVAAIAQAASKPTLTTGGAKLVTYASATLGGSINPQGSGTSYYFQYGPTRAYGGQSAIGSAGAGTKSVPVAVAIAGLQPLTIYHYPLVAGHPPGTPPGPHPSLPTNQMALSPADLPSP